MSVRRAAVLSLILAACGGDDPPPTATTTSALIGPIVDTAPFGTIPGDAGVDGAGNATYRIPIEIPPGIAGMQPDLALEYSSGSPDGPLGVGWRLTGLSAIHRCRVTFAEDGHVEPPSAVDFDLAPPAGAVDALCLDGDRLELESGEGLEPGTVYRPHRDPSVRVVVGSAAGHDLFGEPADVPIFQAYSRDGRIWTYGSPEVDTWRTTVYGGYSTYVWELAKVEDRDGNAWRIYYDAEDGAEDGPIPWRSWTLQMLVKEIDYTDAHPADDDSTVLTGNRKVVFDYEDRPAGDQYDLWSGGIHQRQYRRLKEIRTEVAGTVVRHYFLGYLNSSHSGRSTLHQIRECDDATPQGCLPPTTFDTDVGPVGLMEAAWPGLDPAGDNTLDLHQIRAMVNLDIDDDGHDELLFARPGEDTWEFWDPDQLAIYDTTLPTHGLRDNPALAPAVMDLTGDEGPDMLVPIGDGCDACTDWTVDDEVPIQYATDLEVVWVEDDAIHATTIADDSADRIFIMAAGDFNGDTLGDAWLCRGPNSLDAHWVLALNASSGNTYQFTFYPSTAPCAGYELYEVLDIDDDGADELLVRTTDDSNPDAFTQRGVLDQFGTTYRAIDWDELDTDNHFRFEDTGLELDINQRIQRDVCHPDAVGPHGLPIAQYWPFGFTGPGPDKFGDVNGDGLEDVIRLEALADYPPFDDLRVWTADDISFSCNTDAPRRFEIRVWLNTGRGFVKDMAVASTFQMIEPWTAMRRFEMLTVADIDDDGRADLLGPDYDGADTDWVAHLYRPRHKDENDNLVGGYLDQALPIDVSWNTPGVWDYTSVFGEAPRVIPLRATSTPSGPAFVVLSGLWGGQHPRAWEPDAGVPDHIYRITDGLGGRTWFEYGLASDRDLHTTSATHDAVAARDGLFVERITRDRALGGDYDAVGEATDYHYTGGRDDRAGRGWLGFTDITATTRMVGSPDGDDPAPFRTVRTWFDQSRDDVLHDVPRAGLAKDEITTWDLTGRTLVEWIHDDYDVPSILDGAAFGAYRHEHRERAYDNPACPSGGCYPTDLTGEPFRDTTTKATWDEYGNAQTHDEIAPDGTAISTTTDWTVDVDNWLIARPGLVTTTSRTLNGDPLTRTTQFLYGDRIYPAVRIAEPDDSSGPQNLWTWYHHDKRGLVDHESSQNAGPTEVRTTDYDWGDGYFLQSRTNVYDQPEHFTYDAGLGVLVDAQDVANVHHDQLYDRLGRPSGSRRRNAIAGVSDGADVLITRTGPAGTPGSVMRVIESSGDGSQITRDLDRLGREIRAEWRGIVAAPIVGQYGAAPGVYQLTTYDPHGQVRTVSAPQWVGSDPVASSVLTHDAAGRLISDLEPTDHGNTGTTKWKYVGRDVERTDPDGQITTYHLDDRGSVAMVTDDALTNTCIEHGAFARVERVTRNCNGHNADPVVTTTYTRDAYGQVTATTDPTVGPRYATYDAYGQRIATKDAIGSTVQYTYDHLGRRLSRTAGTKVTTWTWDTAWTGQLASSVSPDGVTRAYTYDSFGRLWTLDTILGAVHNVFTLGYDTQDRVQTLTYPTYGAYGPFRVRYVYDSANYLRAVLDDVAPAAPAIWSLESGTPFGSIHLEDFHDQTQSWWTRDAGSDRVLEVQTGTWSGGTYAGWQDETYEWTAAGDLHQRKDMVTPQTELFDYDGLHQLTSATVDRNPPYRVSYDRVGNITEKIGVYTYEPATFRLKTSPGATYTWTANGDPRTYAGKSFVMTSAGRVKSIDGTLTFDYDADDERIRRTVGGEVTLSIDDLYERKLDAAGTTQKFLVRAAGRIVAEADRTSATSTVWRYIHVDQLGSPAVITDKYGDHVRVSFDPWGRSRNPDAWTNYFPAAPPFSWVIGFTGQQAMLDAGLIDMGARLYDPVVGRFATPDPIVADSVDGLAYNPYAYVRNNPLSRRDPTGLAPTGGSGTTAGGEGEGEGEGGEGDGGNSSGNCRDKIGCEEKPHPKDDGSPVPIEPNPTGEGGEGGGGEGGPGYGGGFPDLSGVSEMLGQARNLLAWTQSDIKEAEEEAEGERMHEWWEMLHEATEESWEGVEIEIEKPEVEEHHFARRSGRLDLHGPNATPERERMRLAPPIRQRSPVYGSAVPVPAQPGLDRVWRTPLSGRAAPALGRSITPPVTVTTGDAIEADNRALDLHGRHGLDDFLDGAWWKDGAVSK